jgi:hypothetical protein
VCLAGVGRTGGVGGFSREPRERQTQHKYPMPGSHATQASMSSPLRSLSPVYVQEPPLPGSPRSPLNSWTFQDKDKVSRILAKIPSATSTDVYLALHECEGDEINALFKLRMHSINPSSTPPPTLTHYTAPYEEADEGDGAVLGARLWDACITSEYKIAARIRNLANGILHNCEIDARCVHARRTRDFILSGGLDPLLFIVPFFMKRRESGDEEALEACICALLEALGCSTVAMREGLGGTGIDIPSCLEEIEVEGKRAYFRARPDMEKKWKAVRLILAVV